MRFEDLNTIKTLLNREFLKLQGYYLADEFDIQEVIEDLAVKNLNPHPLFDKTFLSEELGYDWLIKYINQADAQLDLVMPNKLVDINFIQSFVYSNKSAHLLVFELTDFALNVDFDLNGYKEALSAVEGKISLSHIFGDYCFRTSYAGSTGGQYTDVVLMEPILWR